MQVNQEMSRVFIILKYLRNRMLWEANQMLGKSEIHIKRAEGTEGNRPNRAGKTCHRSSIRNSSHIS